MLRRFMLCVSALLFCTSAVGCRAEPAEAAAQVKQNENPPEEAAPQAKVEWAALLLDGRKAGHARFVRHVQDGVVSYTQDMVISLPRFGEELQVRTATTSHETLEGEPLGFSMEQKLGAQPKQVVGRIEDGKVHVTTTTGGHRKETTFDWPEGALLNEGARRLMEEKGLEPGTEYSFLQYVPGQLGASRVRVRVAGKEQVDLLGRTVELTRVESHVNMAGLNVKATSWVDQDMDALMMELPVMIVRVKLVACPKEYALSPNDPGEFFQRLLTPVPQDLPRGGLSGGLTWRLRGQGRELKLPQSHEQSVQAEQDGTLRVTVRPRRMPPAVPLPYQGREAAARAALEPSEWLQSDAPLIRKLAAEAVDGADDAATAARRIERFVRAHVQQKDLSVGHASALEVARSRQGDCTEHAVLTAALARAAGIPSRVAVGLSYAAEFGGRRRVLVPHAWAQVYLRGRWYSLDAALDGFDAGHLLMDTGQGAPADFMGMAANLGRVRVVSVGSAD